jgi:hypothetical protein
MREGGISSGFSKKTAIANQQQPVKACFEVTLVKQILNSKLKTPIS